MRVLTWLLPLVLLALPAAAAPLPEDFAEGGVSGLVLRPAGPSGRPRPAVILLPDDGGADGRTHPYADALVGAGFHVLEVRSDPADAAVAAAALRALGRSRGVDPGRIALVGFGAGALAALRAPAPAAARVLLYPGCAGMLAEDQPAALDAPLLLLHGDRDPANPAAACDATAAMLVALGADVTRLEYPEAGFAWDYPLFGPERRVLLPWPGRTGRVLAAPWPAMAEIAAADVALYLQARLQPPAE